MTYEEELKHLRSQINRINIEIIKKIKERVDISKRIGRLKQRYNKPIVDNKREEYIYNQIQNLAETYQLEAQGLKRIFKKIVEMSREAQIENPN
jgi:chorismate mutase/prephenate dehydratase